MESGQVEGKAYPYSQQNTTAVPSVWIALLGGLLGGLLGFFVVNAVHPLFPFEELPELGMSPSAELVGRYHTAEYNFRSQNAAFDCGMLGGCVGLVLGMFTSRRRLIGTLLTGVIGLIIGSTVGYVVGRFVAHGLITSSPQSLTQSALIHCVIWGVIGAGIGSVTGFLHRPSSLLNLFVYGLVGGVVGAILFNIAAPLVSPTSNLSIVTPSLLIERIFWIVPPAVAIGLFVGLGLRDSQSSTVA